MEQHRRDPPPHRAPQRAALRTIADLITGWAARGDADAVIAVDPAGALRATSYAELRLDVLRHARALRESGLDDEAPVLLWAPNSRDWVTRWFAICAAGGVVIPLDDQATEEQIEVVLRLSPPARVFTTASHRQVLEAAGLDVPFELLDACETANGEAGPGEAAFEPLAAEPQRVVALLYTSGTTGTPKGVPLTHANLVSNVQALVAADIVGPADRVLLPLPLHHAYPATVGMLTVLASGAAVVLPRGISGPELTTAANATRATILIGVPRLYEVLVGSIDAGIRDSGALGRLLLPRLIALCGATRRALGINPGRVLFRRIRRRVGSALELLASGGARLEPAIARKLEALGWTVITGYGLTETSPVVSFNTPRRRRLDSQGRPLAGVAIRIENPPGEQAGEILVRGPNVFSGYWRDAAATESVFSDGWFRTNDAGFVDDDGFLHVLGRRSEVIVLADGKKISPEPLERLYEASPYIREAALLETHGALAALLVPDETALKKRGTISQQAVLRDEIERRAERLPRYQRIVEFRLARQPLPRTRLGKLRRHLLPDLYSAVAAARTAAAPEAAEADTRLLGSDTVRAVWRWLEARYAERGISLDSSPQLDLGIDSLGWVALTTELEQRFGVTLSAEALGEVVSVRDLLQAVANAGHAPHAARDAARSEAAERYLDPPPLPYRLLAWTVMLALRLLIRVFFRLRVEGSEHLPSRGAMVLTPNHASYLDAPVIAAALPLATIARTCWAGWIGVMHAGPLRRAFSRGAHVYPVDPDRELAAGIDVGAQALARGLALVWFPEGRRSASGEVQAFRRGIGVLLERTRAPAVPVRIRGAFEALPIGRRWPRLKPVTVRFGPAAAADSLLAEGRGEDAASRIADGLERRLRAL